jgi:hypothetical protein
MGKKVNQRAFDHVYVKLKEQGTKSVDEKGNCAYRGENGLKCAAGHLCKDSITEHEGTSFDHIDNIYSYILDEFFGVDIVMVTDMQEAHDSFLGDYGWENEMKSIAKKYNLEFTH